MQGEVFTLEYFKRKESRLGSWPGDQMPKSHIELLGFDSLFYLVSEASCQPRHWKAVLMAQTAEFLSPPWQTWLGSLALRFWSIMTNTSGSESYLGCSCSLTPIPFLSCLHTPSQKFKRTNREKVWSRIFIKHNNYWNNISQK